MNFTVSNTLCECPCAVSTTTRSTPAFTNAATRSSVSGPTPTAAPTRSRPCASLQAFGYLIRFSISLIVINPFSSKFLFTTGSFSIRYS
ncbi:MAG: hypothetical protein KatS3mg082_2149 [Nitrospiraceae bacterium]|nr:MAG: hypothetical protein KatS3mg082_2149 [Nitrospiraceae bacterium]